MLDIKELNKNGLNGKELFLILRKYKWIGWKAVSDIKEFNRNGLCNKVPPTDRKVFNKKNVVNSLKVLRSEKFGQICVKYRYKV